MRHTLWRRPIEDKTYMVSIDGDIHRTEGVLINSIGRRRRIKSIHRLSIMLVVYPVVNMKQKQYYVHQLVMGFIPKPTPRHEVNHKDGDKTNNVIENLEWLTKSENHKHAYATGLNHAVFKEGTQRLGGLASAKAKLFIKETL